MENPKYLLNGQEVVVIEKLQSGYLVASIYEYADDENDIIDTEGTYVVKEVYDSAPTEKLDIRLRELTAKIRLKEQEYRELNKKVQELQRTEKETLEKWSKISALNYLNDFIDGKITHYALEQYGSVSIEEFGKTEAEYCGNERGLGRLKMLTLFGKANGELEWNLNKYNDGSGSDYFVYPCISYEQAQQKMAELISHRFEEYRNTSNYWIKNTIQSAQKHGIKVPKDVLEKYNAAEEKSLLDQINNRRKELQKVEEQLETLRAAKSSV